MEHRYTTVQITTDDSPEGLHISRISGHIRAAGALEYALTNTVPVRYPWVCVHVVLNVAV